MKLINKIINNNVCLYDKYAYFQLAYSRGGHHANLIKTTIAKAPEIFILIKVFDLPMLLGLLVALVLVIIEILGTFYIGHVDLQNHLMDRDVKLSNVYNPDIQEIKRSVRK